MEIHYAIDELLGQMPEWKASDLHLTAGSPPAVRINGRLERVENLAPLTAEHARQLIYGIMSSEQQKHLELKRQLDMPYSMPGVARFRVNVYFQRGSLCAAFRLTPVEPFTLDQLGLPPVLEELTAKPNGLVLVTGATGSGKTTTLGALVDRINETRNDHILTIEDPIEFVHRHKRSIVNQRELGPDAQSFPDALRAALRQDPDVILLGEMRDLETIATALTAAETGHLVLATLHTQNAPGTIDRVIDVFPPTQQRQVRLQLAASLQGVVTQTLVERVDGAGRVAACEVLIPDDAVRNLIRQAKVEQIYSVMQTGSGRGMQTLEQALADLVSRGIVTREAALACANRPEELNGLLERGAESFVEVVGLRPVGR
jgi:twitching motility protein PilT